MTAKVDFTLEDLERKFLTKDEAESKRLDRVDRRSKKTMRLLNEHLVEQKG